MTGYDNLAFTDPMYPVDSKLLSRVCQALVCRPEFGLHAVGKSQVEGVICPHLLKARGPNKRSLAERLVCGYCFNIECEDLTDCLLTFQI